jgi:TonB-dependent SusC/RagA subfamily outer membrane receptor
VTDILEGRVPGLVVQRTSGAPGDPARIRIRGVSSPNLSNDPIIIVDGVRVYSGLSDERAENLARLGSTRYNAPSPLDYIDPHTIETIQVVKGPSAATLYGQDAANGVIVITTKKGQEGPARWTVGMEYGQSRIAGDYPELYLRFGQQIVDDTRVLCPRNDRIRGRFGPCIGDTLVSFQMLNERELTPLDRGTSAGVSVGVSGGSSSLTYSVIGSHREEVGVVALPDYEIERYRVERGTAPPDWMRRPQRLTQWGAASRFQARLGATADVTLTANLSRTEQQRSSLERRLGDLMSTYLDPATGTYYEVRLGGIAEVSGQVLRDYYQRATATATQFTNGISLKWRPYSWVTATAETGLNVIQRADEIFLPAGGFGVGSLEGGELAVGRGTSVLRTANVRLHGQVPLRLGFRFQFAAGIQYTDQSIADLKAAVRGLGEGTESVNRAAEILNLRENSVDRATFGWYIEPGISHRRLWLSTGLRFDGASTFGTRLRLPSFPKLSVSYLISDEPYFPDALRSVFGTLRLRGAYGHAGRQPGPTDRLRLYGSAVPEWINGQFEDAVFLETLGNTELKPERSRELEGGFDADLFADRLSVSVTGYRQTTKDALLAVPVAPSVYGSGVTQLKNIGVVRNEGVELSLSLEPVRGDLVTWRAGLQVSRNRNVVLELGPGVEPFYTEMQTVSGSGYEGVMGIRVAPGYPLFGRWSTPVLGYADTNGNGTLEPGEVLLGDTAVYVGGTLPEYTASLHTTLSLLRGALSISAMLGYDDGLTQRNAVTGRLAEFSRAWNDPSIESLREQLPVVDPLGYTWIQEVNTLRLNSVSVRYSVPERVAQRLGANALSVSLQGTNLGLWTNYRGKDPGVNARVAGNDVADTGVLPRPRMWTVRVHASY